MYDRKCYRIKNKRIAIFFLTLVLIIGYAIPVHGVDVHIIRDVPMAKQECSANESSVTYVGHATALIHLNDLNLLTDPVYSETVSFVIKRHVQPGIRFEDLPVIDAILISHEHWDHLDKATLKRFDKKIPVIISKGLEKKLENMGFTEDIPSAIEMINPDMMIPIHYGVFKLTYEPVDEPLSLFEEVVRKNDLESKVRILEPGEKYSIRGEE